MEEQVGLVLLFMLLLLQGQAFMAIKASLSNIPDVDVHNDGFCDNFSLTVQSLNLANNHLDGTIPHNISSCTALNQFNVHGNQLSGSIPLSFRNLESLTYLNLSANNFKGNIPVELEHFINLDTLDLSSNNFSGHVPASVGYLEHLLTLNLSRNHLVGSLPAELGNLRSIQIIDLSFNNMSGSIPVKFGQLQNLASLILNNNDLRGRISDQLTNCACLSSLINFSYNNLSGAIPSMKNFSRFSADRFIGNPLLCGDWVGSICHPYTPKTREIFSKVAVVCLTLGVLLLLVMVIVAIYRSSRSKQLMKGTGRTGLIICFMTLVVQSHGQFDYFKLAMQWTPTKCALASSTHLPCDPTKFAIFRQQFTIHGLWPSNFSNPQPRRCLLINYDPNDPNFGGMKGQLSASWPDLLRPLDDYFWGGEFEEHGTCLTSSQRTYFGVTLFLKSALIGDVRAAIRFPPNNFQKQPLQGFLRNLLAAYNVYPEVVCNRNLPDALAEVRFCIDYLGRRLIPCPRRTRNYCKSDIYLLA